jgi:hypothetical protein
VKKATQAALEPRGAGSRVRTDHLLITKTLGKRWRSLALFRDTIFGRYVDPQLSNTVKKFSDTWTGRLCRPEGIRPPPPNLGGRIH